ncbi:unnamed protein product [Moneuplotes crassus]|uniref:Uncharacterized protein n=1 Tax=Euplotes crassus TaxID=5936 RepID=A0AAD1Y9T1_EUPCR|nr:unnamed protein product [Moneuplotes crassus]
MSGAHQASFRGQAKTRNCIVKNNTSLSKLEKPVNSEFNDAVIKRKNTTLKHHEIADCQSKVSVLFSAVRNKCRPLLASSTFEGDGDGVFSHPEIPKCEVILQRKQGEEHNSPSIFEQNGMVANPTNNPYVHNSTAKSHKSKRCRFQKRFTRKPINEYKGSKIKTTKSFQLRMENRRTHGSIIHNNIRPKSASLMSRIKRKSYNKIVEKRTSSKARKYKKLIVQNSKKMRLLSSAHPNNQASEARRLDLARAEKLNMTTNKGNPYTMTQNIIIDH